MSKIDYKKMYEDTLFDKITLQKEIDNLKLEYNKLNDKFVIETNELKEHLKKYTAPKRCKIYYENHKEEIINKIKANKPTPEKTKEYNKKSYQNRKLKKQLEQNNINNNINDVNDVNNKNI